MEISVDDPSPNDTLGLLKNYNGPSMPGVINPNASMGQAAYVREQCRGAVRKTILMAPHWGPLCQRCHRYWGWGVRAEAKWRAFILPK